MRRTKDTGPRLERKTQGGGSLNRPLSGPHSWSLLGFQGELSDKDLHAWPIIATSAGSSPLHATRSDKIYGGNLLPLQGMSVPIHGGGSITYSISDQGS